MSFSNGIAAFWSQIRDWAKKNALSPTVVFGTCLFLILAIAVWRNSITGLAELIRSLATILWPILGFAILRTYRDEIRDLLARLRRAKLIGQEIELTSELDKITENLEKSANEIASSSALSGVEDAQLRDDEIKLEERRILDAAVQQPRIALIELYILIERELRHLLASSGWHKDLEHLGQLSIGRMISHLSMLGAVPPNLASSVAAFSDVRNRIIHASSATDDDVVRAIDIGIVLLRTIRAIPAAVHVIHFPAAEAFADSACTKKQTGFHVVVLETTSPGGTQKSLGAFPTTRTHFEKGRRVAWEFDSTKVYPETWYRDPESGECKYGWTSASGFVGRHIEDC